ncbi:MAG: glycosyltransferase family 1 protein [Capnocytophaga sp.]|nr:glycosyltransferase family 1 protein [Capnocytophaga sp.]
MKIGYDAKRIYHNATGLGNYGRDLIRILSEYYPDNQYLLYNPKPKKIDRLPHTDNITEVLPQSKFWKKLSSVWRQAPIVNRVKTDQPNIYHGLSGEIPIGLHKTGVRSIVTIHDLIFVRYPELYSFIDRHIYIRKFRYAAQHADRIIAISEQTKNDVVEFLNISPEQIDVVYQGCHSVFKTPMDKLYIAQTVSDLGLPSEFILNVGTVETRKNILTVIKALKDLDFPLVVVGRKTDYYAEIATYVERNGMQNRIIFLEGLSLEQLAALYRRASLFVYPSVFEGFGIPIIEALYSGTPVLSSNGSCFAEAGGVHSAYADPYDSEAFRRHIKNILNDTQLQHAMSAEGKKFVQKFNDDQVARQMMSVYRKVRAVPS